MTAPMSCPPIIHQIEDAVSCLKQGGLVAIPTETVYGLGADASNELALSRLYQVKGRPQHHPVIVHVAHPDLLDDWAIQIPKIAYDLAAAFWPGPMTLILKRAPHVSDKVTGGQSTIGLRIPNHPETLKLLERFGGGVAAPSANRFGKLSPTTAQQVQVSLGSDVDLILEGGPCSVGVESTIIDLSGKTPRILRPGMILPNAIAEVLGQPVLAPANSTASPIRVPGALASHYAPDAPLSILSWAPLVSMLDTPLSPSSGPIGVLSFREMPPALNAALVRWRLMPNQAEAYAQQLYQSLYQLDQQGCQQIYVESVPETEAWIALQDRLLRAARRTDNAAATTMTEGQMP